MGRHVQLPTPPHRHPRELVGRAVFESPPPRKMRFSRAPAVFRFQCSVTCDRGTQKRVFRCAEKHVSGRYQEVAARKCRHLPPPGLERERACTLSPCPGRPPLAAAGPPRGRWFASTWSQVGRASQQKGGRARVLLPTLAAGSGGGGPHEGVGAHRVAPDPSVLSGHGCLCSWGCVRLFNEVTLQM